MSRVWMLAGVIYQNKLQSTPIPRLRPTWAASEGECWTISEMLTFSHQVKLLGEVGGCSVANKFKIIFSHLAMAFFKTRQIAMSWIQWTKILSHEGYLCDCYMIYFLVVLFVWGDPVYAFPILMEIHLYSNRVYWFHFYSLVFANSCLII
jgi:hypothetical protein